MSGLEKYNVSLDEYIKKQKREGSSILNKRRRKYYFRKRYYNENPKNDKRRRIRVENLNENMINQDLVKLFEQYGKLVRCGIKYDKLGKNTGVADVEFSTHEECEEAIQKLDKSTINDKEIIVKYAPNSGRFRRMRSAGFQRRKIRSLNRSRRTMSTRRRISGIRRNRPGRPRLGKNVDRRKRRYFAKTLGRRRKQD